MLFGTDKALLTEFGNLVLLTIERIHIAAGFRRWDG